LQVLPHLSACMFSSLYFCFPLLLLLLLFSLTHV
jgi:hypothetical protein